MSPLRGLCFFVFFYFGVRVVETNFSDSDARFFLEFGKPKTCDEKENAAGHEILKTNLLQEQNGHLKDILSIMQKVVEKNQLLEDKVNNLTVQLKEKDAVTENDQLFYVEVIREKVWSFFDDIFGRIAKIDLSGFKLVKEKIYFKLAQIVIEIKKVGLYQFILNLHWVFNVLVSLCLLLVEIKFPNKVFVNPYLALLIFKIIHEVTFDLVDVLKLDTQSEFILTICSCLVTFLMVLQFHRNTVWLCNKLNKAVDILKVKFSNHPYSVIVFGIWISKGITILFINIFVQVLLKIKINFIFGFVRNLDELWSQVHVYWRFVPVCIAAICVMIIYFDKIYQYARQEKIHSKLITSTLPYCNFVFVMGVVITFIFFLLDCVNMSAFFWFFFMALCFVVAWGSFFCLATIITYLLIVVVSIFDVSDTHVTNLELKVFCQIIVELFKTYFTRIAERLLFFCFGVPVFVAICFCLGTIHYNIVIIYTVILLLQIWCLKNLDESSKQSTFNTFGLVKRKYLVRVCLGGFKPELFNLINDGLANHFGDLMKQKELIDLKKVYDHHLKAQEFRQLAREAEDSFNLKKQQLINEISRMNLTANVDQLSQVVDIKFKHFNELWRENIKRELEKNNKIAQLLIDFLETDEEGNVRVESLHTLYAQLTLLFENKRIPDNLMIHLQGVLDGAFDEMREYVDRQLEFEKAPELAFEPIRNKLDPRMRLYPEFGFPTCEFKVSEPIDAYSPDEAAKKFYEQIKYDLPDEVKFKGYVSEWSEKFGPGSWQAKTIDVQNSTIVNRDSNARPWVSWINDNLKYYFWSVLSSMMGVFTDVISSDYTGYSENLVKLLYKSDLYDGLELTQIREALFSQKFNNKLKNGKIIDIARQVIDNEGEPQKSKKVNIKKIYYDYLSEQKNRLKKSGEEMTYKHAILELDRVLEGNCLPKRLPYGISMIAFGGTPYLIQTSLISRYGLEVQEMVPVEKIKVCLYFSMRRNNYFRGHITSECCKTCGANFVGICDYGFGIKNIEQGIIIANDVEVVSEAEKNVVQINTDNVNLPIQSIFGVLCNGMVIGNAFMLSDSRGEKYLVTAAHVVASRGDGNNKLPPGRWANDDIDCLDPLVKRSFSRQMQCECYDYRDKFYVVKNVILESATGKKYNTIVEKLDGELAILRITSELRFIDGISIRFVDQNGFTPSYLYLIEQLGNKHVLKLVPVMNVIAETGEVMLNYQTGGGFSGAVMAHGEYAYGIHLGGTDSGKGMAYGRFVATRGGLELDVFCTKHCADCHGLHVNACKPQVGTPDEQERFDTYKNKNKGRGRWRNVNIRAQGDQIVCEIIDSEDSNIKYKIYNLKDFIDRGLDEIIDPTVNTELVATAGVSRFTDRFLTGTNEITVDDLKQRLSKFAETLTPQIHPIPQDMYLDCAKRIGEPRVQELMSQSMTELETQINNLVDQNIELRTRRNEVEQTIQEMEQDYKYQEAKEQYKRELADFIQFRKDYDDMIEVTKNLKKTIQKQREDQMKDFNKKLERLKKEKENNLRMLDENINKYKKYMSNILEGIVFTDNRIKEIKSSGTEEQDKEVIARMKFLDDEIKKLQEVKRQLASEFNHKLEKNVAFIRELKNQRKELEDKYKKQKNELKELQQARSAYVATVSNEEKTMRKEMQESLPALPKVPPFDKERPRPPQFLELSKLNEIRAELNKQIKKNGGLQRVIEDLVRKEKEHLKKVELSRLIEHTKDTGVQCDLEPLQNQLAEITKYYRIFEKMIDPEFHSQRAVAYYKFLLLKSLYHSFEEMLSIINEEFCSECFDDVARVLQNTFSLILRNIGVHEMTEEEKKYFDEVCEWYAKTIDKTESLTNQSLKNVYINLTPSMAHSRAFQENCLAPVSPAYINCSQCDRVFTCSKDHLDKDTGNLSDLGCTMVCMQTVNTEYRSHLGECITRRQIAQMQPSNRGAVSMTCDHKKEGISRRVDMCPVHAEVQIACCQGRQKHDMVSVVLQGVERYMEPQCIMGMLYMIATCPGHEHCNRKPSKEDNEAISFMTRNGIEGKGPNVIIGTRKYYLGALPQKHQVKLLSLVEEYSVGKICYENVEVQSLDSKKENSVVEMLRQEIAELRNEINILKNQIQPIEVFKPEIIDMSDNDSESSFEQEREIARETLHDLSDLCNLERLVRLGLDEELILVQTAMSALEVENVKFDSHEITDVVEFCKDHVVSGKFILSVDQDLFVKLAPCFDKDVNIDGELLKNHSSLNDVIRDQVKKELEKKGKEYFRKRNEKKQQQPRRKNQKGFLGKRAVKAKVST